MKCLILAGNQLTLALFELKSGVGEFRVFLYDRQVRHRESGARG